MISVFLENGCVEVRNEIVLPGKDFVAGAIIFDALYKLS